MHGNRPPPHRHGHLFPEKKGLSIRSRFFKATSVLTAFLPDDYTSPTLMFSDLFSNID